LAGLGEPVAENLNAIAARLERFNRKPAATATPGRGGREDQCTHALGDSVGKWAERIEAINSLLDELTQPTVDVVRVIGAVAKGDLTQSMPLELASHPLQGEYLRTAKLVNGMVGQLGRSPSRSSAWRAKWAPKASWAARRR